MDDGLLDGLFIRMPKNLTELDQLRNSLMARNFDADCMHFIRAESFQILSEPTTWTLDGEWGGDHVNVDVSTEKLVLHLAMPDEMVE